MHSRQGKLLNINVICVDYAFHKVIGCRGVAIIPVTIHSSVTRVKLSDLSYYKCTLWAPVLVRNPSNVTRVANVLL